MRKILTILLLFYTFCSYSQVAILGSSPSIEPDTAENFSVEAICVSLSSELTEGITSYYSFEDTDGLTAADGRGVNDLLLFGSVTQESSGIIGNGYNFTTDAYVGWQEINRFTGDFSIQAWVNTTASTGFDAIVSNYRFTGGNSYGYDLGNYNNVADFSIRDGSGSGNVVSTTEINDGDDHHIVVTYNVSSGLISMYVDGELEDTDTYNAPTYTSYHYFVIGRREVTNYFEGNIDEVGLWAIELSQTKITSLYNAGAGNGPPWGFDCIPDSIRMQVSNFGEGDYYILTSKTGGYSTSPNDGIKRLSFYAIDTIAYKDTTFFWDGETGEIVNFTLWSIKDGTRTSVPNKDTTFSDTPLQTYPDTSVVFDAVKQAPDSLRITSSGSDATATLYKMNYILGLNTPASSDAPSFLFQATDPSHFIDTVLYIPVPANGTIYTIALWAFKDDHWTPVPNIDSVILDAVIPTIDTLGSLIVDFVGGGGGGGSSRLVDSLYGHWSMEDLATPAVDEGTGGHNLVVYGSTAFGETGKVGDCFLFQSGDSYMGGVNTDFEFTGPFSMGVWFKSTTSGVYDGIFTNYYFSTDGYGYDMASYQDHAELNTRSGGSGGTVSKGNIQINDGDWHYLAWAYNQGGDDSLKVWVDGVLDDDDNQHTSAIVYHASGLFYIGRRHTSNYLTGHLDEASVWRGIEVTTAEVLEVYNGGAGSSPADWGSSPDSLRIRALDHFTAADTFQLNFKYGVSFPATHESDSILASYAMDDTTSWNDTTIVWPSYREVDTTANIRHWTGKALSWSKDATSDTVFIKSTPGGSPYTPPDEVGVYDSLFHIDFEHRTSGVYTLPQFNADWGNIPRYMEQRPENWRATGSLGYNHVDSIVTDQATGSQTLMLWSPGDCVDCDGDFDCVTCGDRCPGGNCAIGSFRSGDTWRYPVTPQHEIYLSFNVKFKKDFIPVEGGKLFGFRGGGPDPVGFEPPDDTEGFSVGTMWRPYGGIGFYNFFHNQTSSQYAQTILWDDFQPTGTGLQYDGNGRFIFDFESEEWYNITYRMVNNTFTGGVPNYDGFMEGFINGKLIEQFDGMYLTSAINEGEEIDALIISMFFGGGSNYHGSQRDEHILFDDIIAWTYDESVDDVPRGNNLSADERVINPPGMANKVGAITIEPVQKARVFVLTDIGNEPDDQMSLVRFLSYSNEYDIEGIYANTGVWLTGETREATILEVIVEYGDVRPNLVNHIDDGNDFPTEAYLTARYGAGVDEYGMAGVGSGQDSDASEAIIAAVDAADTRPLWVCAWGGINSLAQAIWKVNDTRTTAQLETFINKIRVYAIADQDDSGYWLRNNYPDLFYVVSPSTLGSSQYDYATWVGISGDLFPAFNIGPSLRVDLVENDWLQTNINTDHGDLGNKYLEHEVIMEGDTPSFLWLINNGLGSANNPSYGGWGGRYKLATPSFSFRTEIRPIWYNSNDSVYADDPIGEQGWEFEDDATVWRWREAFQFDFAARMDWQKSGTYGNSNHNPVVAVAVTMNSSVLEADTSINIIRVDCTEGDVVEFDASNTDDPDSDALSYSWWVYAEAGSDWKGIEEFSAPSSAVCDFTTPSVSQDEIFHVILEVTDDGTPNLTSYRRIIVTVKNQ